MSDHLFGVLDIGLAFALVLGLALWQLVRIRRDREAVSGKTPEC